MFHPPLSVSERLGVAVKDERGEEGSSSGELSCVEFGKVTAAFYFI